MNLDNLRSVLDLRVAPEQSTFVAGVRDSIAEAEVTPDARPWYRAVYSGDDPVGFVMLSDGVPPGNLELLGPYYLWRLLIDVRYQGRGYGRAALDLCCDYVRTRPDGRELLTSVVDEPGGPMPFYLKYGFVSTGQIVDDELVLRLPL